MSWLKIFLFKLFSLPFSGFDSVHFAHSRSHSQTTIIFSTRKMSNQGLERIWKCGCQGRLLQSDIMRTTSIPCFWQVLPHCSVPQESHCGSPPQKKKYHKKTHQVFCAICSCLEGRSVAAAAVLNSVAWSLRVWNVPNVQVEERPQEAGWSARCWYHIDPECYIERVTLNATYIFLYCSGSQIL